MKEEKTYTLHVFLQMEEREAVKNLLRENGYKDFIGVGYDPEDINE